MSDFDSPPPKTKEVKPVISPATFKTNQKQTRELVSTGKLKDTDLNKYSRSNTYTADDGKTQVNRSTVNTIAKFDMGPNIKKGEKLGVISANMRKKYDLKASSFKEEAYDIVLDYVLSEGHAETVEEAHYVMTQMDADTIQTIVKEQGIFKSNVLNKKFEKQPEMTEKGKKILPKLNDPIINGKNYNKIFGISAGSQKALDMLNK